MWALHPIDKSGSSGWWLTYLPLVGNILLIYMVNNNMVIIWLMIVNDNQVDWFTRPGKRLHSELGNHHAINGKINYFDLAIFNSYVTNYQRVLEKSEHRKTVDFPMKINTAWWFGTCFFIYWE